MLIAASIGKKDGRNLLILGLFEDNVARLKNDQPIYKNLADEGVPGLADWDVTILGPEDTARLIAQMQGAQK